MKRSKDRLKKLTAYRRRAQLLSDEPAVKNATARIAESEWFVHKMQNRAAELLGDEIHSEILSSLAGQMQFGYRLAFPSLLINAGKPMLSVALLARANDPRVRRINGLNMSPQADHVFVFMVFANEAEWLRYAKQVVKIFPEQPQFNGT